MTFELPWILLMVLCPALGAVWVHRCSPPERARRRTLICCGLTLLISLGAGARASLPGPSADHIRETFSTVDSGRIFAVDAVNAPLLPLVSLAFFLTALTTLRTKFRQFSFTRMLISQALLMATLSSQHRWAVVTLLAAGTIPPWLELRALKKPTRVYLVHMLLFVVLLISGQSLVDAGGEANSLSLLGIALLIGAVLLRSGCVPMHCWITDLFEHATFGTALLTVTPMVGAYAAMRLVLPIAPDGALHAIAVLSLITAVYSAGMALVQSEARRFFCYVFLSHSSLVLVGLETVTALGLTGGLCVWLSVGLSLTGFGLVLRSVEARTGRLSLATYHGLLTHTPRLAALFLLTGLASIGFPGTLGFVGSELLIDAALRFHPAVVVAVVAGSALNGLAVVKAYFHIFTGTRHAATIDLRSRPSERIAVLILAALIIGGGLYPQPGVTSRYAAARQLMQQRGARFGQPSTETEHIP
ncbi:proton-conducting transporter membrane subunit [Planctomicrobium sp. SH661]|uniref:proton-conducting transporter transmembrane domain-containing protein n=1 Tax=Planctomicrobium sp. SH661 TaxID=3448124 RepID=UPI003F5B81A9